MQYIINTGNAIFPHNSIYKLSENELKILKNYLNKNFKRGYIQRSINSINAPILFVFKKNGKFRLYVNYKDLNKITIKNRYSLSLIKEILNRFNGTAVYTKFNFKNIYYKIRIRKKDEWKTTFKIRYSYFEYKIILFNLINAPAIFQAYINKTLIKFININCVTYLNDILIYFSIYTEHQRYIRQILERLRQYKLYIKLSKCEFSIILVIFLKFVINIDRIKMDINKIEIIVKWLKPKFVKNIQIFLSFINFYRRFIKNYSRIAAPLTSMLKDNVNGRKINSFEFIDKEKAAFELLSASFIRAPMLIHFKFDRPIRVETNISDFAIIGMLS
jgi:hypothetical protein